jgi:hypothetical protein
MRYLECLSTALSELAHLYQPAQRMSVVLRAVMVELRGGCEVSHPGLDIPTAAAVPARRGSTNAADSYEDTKRMGKKRQIDFPRPDSALETKAGSMNATPSAQVMNHNANINVNANANVNASGPHVPHFGDATRMDGYTVIPTPPWQVSNPPLQLSHGLSTLGNTPSYSHPAHSGSWMTSGFNTNNSLSTVHFPNVGSFHREVGGVDSSGAMDLGGGNWDMSNEWAGDVDMWSDSYGFPLQGGSNGPGG